MENTTRLDLLTLLKRFKLQLVIIFFFLSIIVLITLISSRSSQTPSGTPIPTPYSGKNDLNRQPISPLQKTEIGKPLSDNFEQSIPVEKKETTVNNETIYSFKAPVAIRQNQVITNNNIVVFERILTPEGQSSLGYATISGFLSRFNSPEKEVRGSKTYGWYVNTYIYASQGLTFIGNPSSDEVYEIQRYTPTTVDMYIQKYGDDLNPEAMPPQE